MPFGRVDAVLTCAVLRVCVVELEPGEVVADAPLAGDQARWIIRTTKAGPQGTTTLIAIKPKRCAITTNLVIPTDRRIYDVLLTSPPCPGHDSTAHSAAERHLRFSYPDESVLSRSTAMADTATRLGAPPVAPSVPAIADPAPAPERTNTDYRIVRHRHLLFGHAPIRFPWRPAAMYDDGAHAVIVLPPEAAHEALPVLYVVGDDGTRTLLNYVVRDSLLITDRTFHRAVLVLDDGGTRQELVIENRGSGHTPVRRTP
ncbi:MAG: TrbG/VirB9 family P-type conjugative transfer protein [Gemmatimonadaceae bacterium]|nr:TrbG/VirB9 family P-type conjugative transfer protein [Gemmatimonadaceae bacterium]